jgi:hypothetical protein
MRGGRWPEVVGGGVKPAKKLACRPPNLKAGDVGIIFIRNLVRITILRKMFTEKTFASMVFV